MLPVNQAASVPKAQLVYQVRLVDKDPVDRLDHLAIKDCLVLLATLEELERLVFPVEQELLVDPDSLESRVPLDSLGLKVALDRLDLLDLLVQKAASASPVFKDLVDSRDSLDHRVCVCSFICLF